MPLFISIKIPEDICKGVLKLEGELKSLLNSGRWNRNIHLTLSFLGEVSEEKIPSIIDIMSESAKVVSPFQVSLKGVDSFPDRKNSKILWLGVTEGAQEVSKIQSSISSRLDGIVEIDGNGEGFIPHITLGRFSPPLRGDKLKKTFETFGEHSVGSFPVDAIYLTKSQLDSSGAVHTDIGEVLIR